MIEVYLAGFEWAAYRMNAIFIAGGKAATKTSAKYQHAEKVYNFCRAKIIAASKSAAAK